MIEGLTSLKNKHGLEILVRLDSMRSATYTELSEFFPDRTLYDNLSDLKKEGFIEVDCNDATRHHNSKPYLLTSRGRIVVDMVHKLQGSGPTLLAPCPFCGWNKPYHVEGQRCILCPVCLNEMRNCTALTKDDLFEKWNRRVNE